MMRISRNLRKFFYGRYYFSSNQTDADQVETQSIEVSIPLFPLNKIAIQLSSRKYQVFELMRLKVQNITAIVKNDQVSEPKTFQEKYYQIGTYCVARLEAKTNIYQMILNGVQRVQIQKLEEQQFIDPNGSVEAIIHPQPEEQIIIEQEDQDESPENSDESPQQNDEVEHTHHIQPTRQIQEDIHPTTLIKSLVQFIHEPNFEMNITVESQLKHLIDTYSKILYMNRSQVPLVNYNFADAYRIIDSLAGFLGNTRYFDVKVMQETLETIPLAHRLDQVHNLMTKYLVFLQYYSDVGQLAQQNLKARKAQEFYNEMFRIVKGAVEGKKGKEAIIEQMTKRLALTKPPDHVKKIFQEETQRYLQMDDMSAESNMLRSYLDWISCLPYGQFSKENMDLQHAKKILDEDHYGMDEIKERILEFMAVSSLSSTTKGRILLLVGPPGVGKTSLASSIAKAVGRPFARISLGGESDVSFLKGHRRTYVGAYPGKIIQALKSSQKQNCVILLDEIDKLGRSEIYGDPQATLLEILDPEQNRNFTDNYLDYSVDLSNVLFICSANSTHTIQPPLLDRMDIIELSSYTNHEKKEIYQRHLLKKAIADTGLTDSHQYYIEPDVLDVLINDYCREPGVRSLEKYAKKIIEKIAFQIIQQQEQQQAASKVIIHSNDLVKIIGQPRFSDFKLKKLPPGVVIGLAYTSYGGSLLYLEVTQAQFLPKGHQSRNITSGLKVTGSLGDVMQESIQIAYTYAKLFAHINLSNSFFENNELHIHAPEGAIPKDGPSAGITITSALLSLALDARIPNDIGMTGEISLNGLVLPIGGCKEKILAAQREGLKRLIFPEKNRAQIQKLKDEVKQGIQIYYVKEYKDVFKILFPQIQLGVQQQQEVGELATS